MRSQRRCRPVPSVSPLQKLVPFFLAPKFWLQSPNVEYLPTANPVSLPGGLFTVMALLVNALVMHGADYYCFKYIYCQTRSDDDTDRIDKLGNTKLPVSDATPY